jgi:hypothetical protein
VFNDVQVQILSRAPPLKLLSYKVADYGADGRRRFRTFGEKAKAEEYAKSLIRARFGRVEKIVMLDQEKEDWQSAVTILKKAGIKSPLPRVAQHYVGAAEVLGSEDLIVEAARFHAKKHERSCARTEIGTLVDAFTKTQNDLGRSKRYVQSLKHYLGTFAEGIGRKTTTDHLTRELLERFNHRVNQESQHSVISAFWSDQRDILSTAAN